MLFPSANIFYLGYLDKNWPFRVIGQLCNTKHFPTQARTQVHLKCQNWVLLLGKYIYDWLSLLLQNHWVWRKSSPFRPIYKLNKVQQQYSLGRNGRKYALEKRTSTQTANFTKHTKNIAFLKCIFVKMFDCRKKNSFLFKKYR